MMQKTHGVAGVIAAEAVLLHYQQPLLSIPGVISILLGCLAGPLADVDKSGSLVAKMFFPLSWVLQRLRVEHRTATHSILIVYVISLLTLPLPEVIRWAFVLAYATHPFIDMFNPQGVQLLWPLKKRVRFLPQIIAVRTNSWAETIFLWILMLISFILFLILLDQENFPFIGPYIKGFTEYLGNLWPARS